MSDEKKKKSETRAVPMKENANVISDADIYSAIKAAKQQNNSNTAQSTTADKNKGE